ncbi:GNAT family N-acetyltransferase [Bacterioplanes sanyensis]|uniref:Protein ElaA n=1 Tax=Bacterioplanes sanyensis TaxID=1249553 RepID=A0A222FG21_9GAMM|nr:GNAT family N-acetyltransferase [Bacterioplanes sanyensis]ASP37444.1 GNAT family N-acetyltransferase [Bacterioplanes sanyensis]
MTRWTLLPLAEMTAEQVYRLLQLRSEVFVVEQTCPYQDMDDKDLLPEAYQLVGWIDDQPVTCARLLAPGISYDAASIGRVVTRQQQRGTGLGHELMQQALQQCTRLWPQADIEISAQLYLKAFYQGHGFVQISDTYLEDDIPHIHMIRNR